VISGFSEFKHFAANEALIQIAHSISPRDCRGSDRTHAPSKRNFPAKGNCFLTKSAL
jgi:hypothetical protein